MSPTETLSALKAELRARRHQERFADACARHPVLADLGTLPVLLERLADSGERGYETSEALAIAFLTEQQAASSPLWTGLLLLLFEPMLGALRASVRGAAMDAEELDAVIIGHFLEVAQAHPLRDAKPGHTLVALRSKTRRAVFRELKHEQREQTEAPATDPHLLFDLLDGALDLSGYRSSGDESEADLGHVRNQMRQVAFLREHCGGELDDEQLDLVLHTQVRGGRLCDYVDEHYPELSPEERTRTYERLKRQHGRSLEVIRGALAHLRHPRPAEDTDEVRDLEDCGSPHHR